MTCHWCCRFSSLLEAFFVLSLITLFPGFFSEANAEELKHFCIYPSQRGRGREKVCNLEEKGYGLFISKVRLSTKAKTFTKSECNDLYDDDDTETIPLNLKQILENACNGFGSCMMGDFQSPNDSNWAYVITYKCIRVGTEKPFDPSKPTFNLMRSYETTKVTGSAVLSMRVSAQQLPVNRTCHAFSANDELTLTMLHLDLTGSQNSTSCSGLINVTSGSQKSFSVNCSETESASYSKKSLKVAAGNRLTVSLSLSDGFVWLKINGAGESGFTISCNKTTKGGKPTMRPDPSKTQIPYPSQATDHPNVQPVPMTTTSSTATTTLTTSTTTSSQPPPPAKDPTGSITIVVAVVSAIAGVATTVAIVLAVYLCKTRDSPYQRWRQKRQSRIVAVQDAYTRPKPRHHASHGDEEYARMEPNDIMRSPHSTAAADSGMYDTTDDSYVPPPLPLTPSPRPVRSQEQAPDLYVNETAQAEPVGGQGRMYSEVVMMNPKDSGVKIYAPGFYHTVGNKEPSPRPGGDPYDVMGATSGQYMHLRDPAVKENYLHKNIYDG